MSWAPRQDPGPPTRRSVLTYWAWVWRVWAIWSALWATGVAAIYASHYAHGFPVEPNPFWLIVPLAYLLAYAAWRMSRHLFRRRNETNE